jgi:hypothetical protein
VHAQGHFNRFTVAAKHAVVIYLIVFEMSYSVKRLEISPKFRIMADPQLHTKNDTDHSYFVSYFDSNNLFVSEH